MSMGLHVFLTSVCIYNNQKSGSPASVCLVNVKQMVKTGDKATRSMSLTHMYAV